MKEGRDYRLHYPDSVRFSSKSTLFDVPVHFICVCGQRWGAQAGFYYFIDVTVSIFGKQVHYANQGR